MQGSHCSLGEFDLIGHLQAQLFSNLFVRDALARLRKSLKGGLFVYPIFHFLEGLEIIERDEGTNGDPAVLEHNSLSLVCDSVEGLAKFSLILG